MQRIIPVLAVSLFVVSTSIAQSYKTAAGLRLSEGIHLNIQQHIGGNWTAEGIVHTSFHSSDLGITLLGERHHKIIFRGFNIYWGAGGHYYWKSDASGQENQTVSDVFGLSFIGGAELTLGKLNFAIDYKPELHLSGDQTHPFEWNGAAISVRYVFAKRKKERTRISEWDIWGKNNFEYFR